MLQTNYGARDAGSDHDFINQGLLAKVHVSNVFQNWATTDLSTCRRFASICVKFSSFCRKILYIRGTHLQLGDIPVLDLGIGWVACQ